MAAFGLAAGCTAVAAPAAAWRPVDTAPFVYAVNTKSNAISQYSASPSNSGALRALATSTVPTGPFPYGIGIDPQGTSVYVADVGSAGAPASEVSQYTINRFSGQLTPKSRATVAAGRGPVAIAVSPNGTSAYVVDGKSNAVSQYSINPATGALTPKSPATVATGRQPEPIAITPNGKYAYVANCPSCTVKLRGPHSASPPKPTPASIWEYRINQNTGTLSLMATVTTGTGANGMAITPNGKSLYVAVGAVWQYSINPSTGELTPKSPATIAAPGTAHDLAIAPDGRYVYIVTVANNTVSQYRINPSTGALSSKPASTARTALHPEAIKIAPDGKYVYVTSENDGVLSQFAISPATGKITPMSRATVPTASGSLGLAVTPAADLSARITAPATARPGQALTYTITITNSGPSDAWQAALTDHLPAGTAFRSASTASGRCSRPSAGTRGATVTCRLGKLKAGGTVRIQVQVTIKASSGTIRDKATSVSVTPDSRRSNNTASAATKIAK
jgi:uncharacterized repeat protein (TIGR01451 family)